MCCSIFAIGLFVLNMGAHQQIVLARATSAPFFSPQTKVSDGIESCRSFPGSTSWPVDQEWASFNETVGGRLVATVPLGSPCHDPNFNIEQCTTLRSEWLLPSLHYNSSSSIMAPLIANQSCDPFQPRNDSCTLGNYVVYAVNASGPEDIAAAVRFADSKNVRLVIRNTGHDHLGRSTGAGALSIWTHHLKDIEILEWADANYRGKALRVGAGVQGFEALNAAAAAGLVVVTGECPSVGIAGGYTQGGGHSMLSTAFGLSADNTLEFEVVTADGRLITASPMAGEHADLYWALSGGGAGNYGVVVSMTIRAHPDETVSGTGFGIDAPVDMYPLIVDAFHAELPSIVDSGAMIIYTFSNTSFRVAAMTAYNRTQRQAESILAPFVTALAAMSITVHSDFTQFESYRDHFLHYFGPFPDGIIGAGGAVGGGRLIPRSVATELGPTVRALMDLGVTVSGIGLDVSRFGRHGANAVLPQWRNSIASWIVFLPYSFTAPFSDMLAEENAITDVVMPIVEAATPGAGAYMNEADFQDPNWQKNFYGSNYDRLSTIKNKYDSKGLFYATAAVNSAAWTVVETGRLCKRRASKNE